MAHTSEFHGYGRVFTFEPPVDMGEHAADSLGKIAAVAIMGADSNTTLVSMGEESANAAIHHAGSEPDMLAVMLNSMLEGKHTVSVS